MQLMMLKLHTKFPVVNIYVDVRIDQRDSRTTLMPRGLIGGGKREGEAMLTYYTMPVNSTTFNLEKDLTTGTIFQYMNK